MYSFATIMESRIIVESPDLFRVMTIVEMVLYMGVRTIAKQFGGGARGWPWDQHPMFQSKEGKMYYAKNIYIPVSTHMMLKGC